MTERRSPSRRGAVVQVEPSALGSLSTSRPPGAVPGRRHERVVQQGAPDAVPIAGGSTHSASSSAGALPTSTALNPSTRSPSTGDADGVRPRRPRGSRSAPGARAAGSRVVRPVAFERTASSVSSGASAAVASRSRGPDAVPAPVGSTIVAGSDVTSGHGPSGGRIADDCELRRGSEGEAALPDRRAGIRRPRGARETKRS